MHMHELHAVKRMTGGSGGARPSSDSQTRNACAASSHVDCAVRIRMPSGPLRVSRTGEAG